MKKLWLASFLAVQVACVSVPGGFQEDRVPADWHERGLHSQKSCLSADSPYLSAYLQIPGQPHLKLEGVWEQRFKKFRGQVLPPGNIGGSLARITADSNGVVVDTMAEGETLPQVLSAFQKFLEHLKPMGLRKIVCGYLWGQKGRWFTKKGISDRCPDGDFIIKDTKNFPGFVTLTCVKRAKSGFEFSTEFWKDSVFAVKITDVRWVGNWGRKLAPKAIYLGDEVNTIHLAVDEFE